MSLVARLSNIIAAPGDAFDDVKASVGSAANWLVPVLGLILIGWIATAVIFANPSIQQQLRDMTDQALQKQFASSNMSQQQIDQMKETSLKFASISQSIGAYLGIPVVVFCSTFFWGLVMWFLGVKVFKGSFPFMKAVEAAGLCNVIAILDSIIRTLLVLVMGNLFAAPSLMLVIKNFDAQNTLHGALANIELFTMWMLLVRAIALSRLSGASLAKTAAWVYGIWLAYMGTFIALGAIMKAVFAQLGHAH